MIKNEEKLILEELEKLQLKFPSWDFSAELKPIESEKEWKVIETILETLQEEVRNKMNKENNEQ